MTTKQERLDLANKLIAEIAKHGRKFFSHEGRVARLEMTNRGLIYLVDAYTSRPVYTNNKHEWRGFSHGYTLQRLIIKISEFVKTGEPCLCINSLGYSPNTWEYPIQDLLPIWEVAKPMFSDKALRQLDQVTRELEVSEND